MKNVLVLFGGASSEHDVSTVSASSVLKQIPQEKYSIYMMGITKEGQWYLYEGDVDALPEDGWLTSGTCTPAFVSPDRGIHGITVLRENGYENIRIDIAFPVLHGKNGEDGTIQGLFQMAGIPFVGCDMASSAVSMDKVFTNTVADANGVPQAAWDSITAYEYRTGAKTLDEVADKLGYPIFVKPANAGSSVGITKAHDRAELEGAMELALRHDTRILFEEFIDGYEVECAVLGNDELETGVVGQIKARLQGPRRHRFLPGRLLCREGDRPRPVQRDQHHSGLHQHLHVPEDDGGRRGPLRGTLRPAAAARGGEVELRS